MDNLVIEHAKSEDAEAILRLKRAAWLDAYPNQERGVTLEDIHNKFTEEDVRAGIKNWQKGIDGENEDGNRRTFVARVGNKVVGFTSPTTEDGQKRVGQLYVAPDYQNRGIGSTLLKKALQWHGDSHDIYLHVVSYNDNAINFYKKFGFQKTGKRFAEEFNENHEIKFLPEVEMVRKALH